MKFNQCTVLSNVNKKDQCNCKLDFYGMIGTLRYCRIRNKVHGWLGHVLLKDVGKGELLKETACLFIPKIITQKLYYLNHCLTHDL